MVLSVGWGSGPARAARGSEWLARNAEHPIGASEPLTPLLSKNCHRVVVVVIVVVVVVVEVIVVVVVVVIRSSSLST